jgi:tetratricopeptide (TPR) repeat protein
MPNIRMTNPRSRVTLVCCLLVSWLAVLAPGAPVAAQDGGGERGDELVLPQRVGEGEVVDLLQSGDYSGAIEKANQKLSERQGDIARLLYLRGKAELAQAEQSGERSGYLDAGLSFMMVVAYFSQDPGLFVGPSLVEAGYVHQQIGRSDKANELYDEAAQYLTQQSTPVYFKRLEALRGQ